MVPLPKGISMSRYDQTNVSSIAGVNSELQKVQAAIATLLDLYGEAPNSMESDLDLNSNSLLNVAQGVAGTDGVNLNQLLSLVSPSSFVAKTLEKNTATTAGQTVFTAPTYVIGNNSLEVFVNGQRQFVTDNYTETSTSTFTLASPGVNIGDVVYAIVVTIGA